MAEGHTALRLRPTIRLFISSTFSDMKHERNALQEHVFPRLEEFCGAHGFQFQAIDLRWGVSSEAGLDHRTMRICLDELRRAQEISPKPNFLILLGNRYGWRPLPETVSVREFGALLDAAAGCAPGIADVLRAWYREDANAVPTVHVLQSRRQELRDGQDYTVDANWAPVQAALWAAINRAMPPDRLRARFDTIAPPHEMPPPIVQFQASATEQEVWHGALHVADASEHVVAFLRDIEDVRDVADAGPIRDFVDVAPSGGLAVALFDEQERLKDALRRRLDRAHVLEASAVRFLPVRERAGRPAADITLDHLPRLCVDVEARLTRIIEGQIDEYWQRTTPASAERGLRDLQLEQEEYARVGQERCGATSFVGREDELARISRYLRSEESWPLVVHGASGCGKTTLLARAAHEAAALQPVVRLIGVHPRSSDLRGLLGILIQELRVRHVRDGEIPVDVNQLREELVAHLRAATPAQPLVLFLDALDQLGDAEAGRLLRWLPAGPLPRHVKIVVSCLSDRAEHEPAGQPYAELRRRQLPAESFVSLDALSEADAAALVCERWLPQAGRTVTPAQRAVIERRLVAAACRQPIYLRLLFEEVRLWRSSDRVSDPGDDVPALLRRFCDRLGQPTRHGPVLVERVLGYLVASRHGLAEHEILELLFLDPEYRAALDDATERTHHEMPPTATRIPMAIWSRLRFDLATYLTERAAPGANVLTFYHRQVAEWIQREYGAASGRGWNPHQRLADYFRARADPQGDATWLGTGGRPLEELPHHLRGAGQIDAAAEVMRQFRYLDARCAYASVLTLCQEFGALASGGDAESREWHDFLLPRIGALSRLPDTLPALAWREAPAFIRRGVEEYGRVGSPRRPWLKLDDVTAAEQSGPAASGPVLEIRATCRMRTVVGAVSIERSVGFYLERLGSVALLSLREGAICASRLTVPRRRLLAMAASRDGEVLAVVDEGGSGLALRLQWPADGALDPTVVGHEAFRCRLPEEQPPPVIIMGRRLCWQEEDGRLCQKPIASAAAQAPGSSPVVPGEIRGLFAGNGLVFAWSVESRLHHVLAIDADGNVTGRQTLPRDAASVCLLNDQRLFCLCVDGSTLLVSLDRPGEIVQGPPLPDQMAGVLPLGGGAVLTALNYTRHYWSGQEGALIEPLDVLPVGYGTVLALAEDGDDVLSIMAGSAFWFTRSAFGEGRAASREHVWAVSPGQHGYHAIVDRSDGAYCVSSEPLSIRRFEDEPVGPLEAVGTASTMVLMKRAAPARVWHPPDGVPRELRTEPGILEACAPDSEGRLWFVNSLGELYTLSGPDTFKGHVTLPVNQPRRHRIVCGSGYLFWTGLSLGLSASGMDNLETMIVYQIQGQGASPRLERVGQRMFDPDDGLWTLSIWDPARQELACVFQHQSEKRHIVRAGTPDDLLHARERVIPLHVAVTELWAALPFAGDRAWLVRSTEGPILALERGTFRQLAAFEGASTCSALACMGGPGSDALLVQNYTRVLQCSLVG